MSKDNEIPKDLVERVNSGELQVVLDFKNGCQYKGGWVDGLKMHGKGRFTEPDGNYYEGDWVKGMRQGYGVYAWTDGEKYEGEWQNNVRHGYGKWTTAAGEVWEGEWCNDEQYRENTTTDAWKQKALNGDAKAAYRVAGGSLQPEDWVTVHEYAELAVKLSDGKGKYAHESLNLLGLIYLFGHGEYKKDHQRAFEYYSQAAELGNDESQCQLALFYMEGNVVPQDFDKAVELLEKSIAQGNDEAKHFISGAKMAKQGLIDKVTIHRPDEE